VGGAWLSRAQVKVGKDVDTDARALEAVGRAAPRVRLRVDANAGYTATEAIALATACRRLGLDVECWEQPCAAADHDGMAEVAAELVEPVIADESVKHLGDVHELARVRYADGVNLKLAKLGGVFVAVAAGEAARAAGLKLMIGGMVETRLGMTAAAHVACALGGVDWVDLDTAWLLATDPYDGGYVADGPRYTMPDSPGLGVARARR
jgi:L-alanine-DL-glutamate epimerase-like enolase superfamily enzyme